MKTNATKNSMTQDTKMIGFMAVEQGVEGVEEAKLAVEHTKKSDFLPFSPFPLSSVSCIDL
jgi:hypothetical protein